MAYIGICACLISLQAAGVAIPIVVRCCQWPMALWLRIGGAERLWNISQINHSQFNNWCSLANWWRWFINSWIHQKFLVTLEMGLVHGHQERPHETHLEQKSTTSVSQHTKEGPCCHIFHVLDTNLHENVSRKGFHNVSHKAIPKNLSVLRAVLAAFLVLVHRNGPQDFEWMKWLTRKSWPQMEKLDRVPLTDKLRQCICWCNWLILINTHYWLVFRELLWDHIQ